MMNFSRSNIPEARVPSADGERGYVLIVFVLFAALLLAGLSAVIRTASFEGRRDKEEELIFRGQQYQRAIQLFFRKNGRYPASMDELESTNGVRFLRKRYAEPMSKDGEWRIIHIGPNGALIDSTTGGMAANANPNSNAAGQPFGPAQQTDTGSNAGTQTSGQIGQNPTGLSFGGPAAGTGTNPGTGFGVPSNSGAGTPAASGASQQQASPPFAPSAIPGATPQAQQSVFGQGQQPGQFNLGGAAQPGSLQSGIAQPGTQPGVTVQPGGAQPSIGSSTLSQSAVSSTVFGSNGAIAGFASKSKDASIKTVNGYSEYDKWEFIYNYRQDPLAMARMGIGSGTLSQQTISQPSIQAQPQNPPQPTGGTPPNPLGPPGFSASPMPGMGAPMPTQR